MDSLTTALRMREAEVLLDTTKLSQGTSSDAIRRRLMTRHFRSLRTSRLLVWCDTFFQGLNRVTNYIVPSSERSAGSF